MGMMLLDTLQPLLLIASLTVGGLPLAAQQPIGRTSATEVQVSGAVDVSHGEMLLGNGSEITAGNQAVKITLQRGGELRLCSTSSVHLAKDRTIADPASSALMMALDRGAIEANYAVGKYSDELLTPDLRILISGPGEADLSIRVNTKGDTCVDNHGANAPYVTVSSQLEGGVYRVLPDQRVTFEHGSLREVVDHEPEPCGCPAVPVTSVAAAGNPATHTAPAGRPVGGPSSTPADTAFPIAESEGLAAPPTPKTTPVVPTGETHVQVTVPLAYNGENPPPIPEVPPVSLPARPEIASPPPAASTVTAPTAPTAPTMSILPDPDPVSAPPDEPAEGTVPQPTAPAAVAATPEKPSTKGTGLFHRLGHFFSKIFGQ
jgi:hypothetical protein